MAKSLYDSIVNIGGKIIELEVIVNVGNMKFTVEVDGDKKVYEKTENMYGLLEMMKGWGQWAISTLRIFEYRYSVVICVN